MPATKERSTPAGLLKRAEGLLNDNAKAFHADRAAYQAVQAGAGKGEFAVVADALELLATIRKAHRELALKSRELIELDAWPEGSAAAFIEEHGEDVNPARQRGGPTANAETGSKRWKPTPAAYLVSPPLVGADGRALRDFAERIGVPTFVVVREPTTKLNLWPVVMVGPAVVRVRVPPPDRDKPTIDWMLDAHEQLGQEAIRECETEERLPIRFDLIMERIATLHYDRALFDAAIETARTHAGELASAPDEKTKRRPKKDGASTTQPDETAGTDEPN